MAALISGLLLRLAMSWECERLGSPGRGRVRGAGPAVGVWWITRCNATHWSLRVLYVGLHEPRGSLEGDEFDDGIE